MPLISGLVGSCIAVIVIAVFFEGLKSYKGHRHKPCKKNNETTPLIRQPHRIQNRFQVTDHLKKTLLYVVQFLVGYFLMLVAMTYNVWLFLAVVVGFFDPCSAVQIFNFTRNLSATLEVIVNGKEKLTGMEKYSYHEIHELISNGPLEDIQKVSEDIGLNAIVRQDKWTLLHAASATNRPDVTQYLIYMGSDVNVLDKEGKSPLYYCQSEEAAKMMVDAGAEVNHPSILGKTPLHYACISNATPAVVKLLLQSGARVNAEDNIGNTPFLYACDMAYGCIDEEEFANNLPKINILIEHGADVHHINSKGENGLHVCSRSHTYEIVEILLKHGVDVNALNEKQQTPLAMACVRDSSALNRREGILTTLELLLQHGADPMIPDEEGLTPLHVLMLHHCDSMSGTAIASCVKVLVKRGAVLNARDNMLRTPVHYAGYAAAHGNWPGILQKLVSLGGDVNLQDVEGFTPVHVTATRGPSPFTTIHVAMGLH
ncbi:hypothetical protein ACROYT_G002681 [Oculina patagonica]